MAHIYFSQLKGFLLHYSFHKSLKLDKKELSSPGGHCVSLDGNPTDLKSRTGDLQDKIPCHHMGNKGSQFMSISYLSVDKDENITRLFLPFVGMIGNGHFFLYSKTPPNQDSFKKI